jgi:hypothetical protein
VAPQRSAERDDGMRRITAATRWLAGIGAALVVALSLFFADRASSSGSSPSPSVNTPIATAPTTNGGGAGSPSSSPAQPVQPVQTAPPVTYAPQHHTRSGGS